MAEAQPGRNPGKNSSGLGQDDVITVAAAYCKTVQPKSDNNSVEVKFMWQISYPPANGVSQSNYFLPKIDIFYNNNQIFHSLYLHKGLVPSQSDDSNQMIPITVITISGGYCSWYYPSGLSLGGAKNNTTD